jgi:hypothetical protein
MIRFAAALSLLAFVACVALAQSSPGSATDYTVRTQHPRILLTPEMLPEVFRRCGPGGAFEASYLKKTEEMRKKISVDYAALHFKFKNENPYGAELALAYLVETKMGRDGKLFIDHFRKIWGPGGVENVLDVFWDAVAYDWMHDGFTTEERRTFGNRLGKHLRHYTKKPEITLENGTYWYNQTWASSLSWARDAIALKTAVALAILGEGTDFEEDARTWLNSFAQRMPEEFVKKLDQVGGIWPEGPQHGSVAWTLYLTWEAWRTATGQDLFPKVAPTGFHRELPYWVVYDKVPHTGYMSHQDDCGPGQFRGLAGADLLRALHATRYRDGLTQAWTKGAVASGKSIWADAFWYDPEAPTVDQKTFPLAYHFEGAGRVYMRSLWGDGDDTWAVFTAGPFLTSYGTQGETGSFQIMKQGTLVGEAGNSHYTSRLSMNENVVLVYDRGEKYESHGAPLVNDGGPQIPHEWHVLEPLERGRIVAYQHTDDYTYIGADLTKAYSHAGSAAKTGSEKIVECTRQFVYVRGEPEFFVIYDRVRATDAAFPKTWLLHVTGEPLVTAAGKALVPSGEGPGFQTFPGADLVLTKVRETEEPSRDVPWRTTRRGAMAVRTLLPKDARITKRGGVGFDMWGNPHDPMAGNMKDPESKRQTDMDICLWRIEVEPMQGAKDQCFLHVLMPFGDAKEQPETALMSPASAFTLVESATHDGVSLKSEKGTWEISFPRSGPIGATLKIKTGSGKAVSMPIPAGIQPNSMPKGLAIRP